MTSSRSFWHDRGIVEKAKALPFVLIAVEDNYIRVYVDSGAKNLPMLIDENPRRDGAVGDRPEQS
jgi:hypothetical protein